MLDFPDLTSRQAGIYVFVRDTVRAKGFAPSVREIGACFGILSPNGVMCHLKALERKGYIRRDANAARAITLVRESVQKSVGLPIAGRVAAGALEEAIEDSRSLDLQRLAIEGDKFALQIVDESLVGESVRSGDYLIFDRSCGARVGDVVAARCGEATAVLFRVRAFEEDGCRLTSLSAGREVRLVSATRMLGTLVAVVRSV